MWPATAAGHERGLGVFWPSTSPATGSGGARHITCDDGRTLGEKCGGLEAERASRVMQWRDGMSTDFGRPVPELMQTDGKAWDTPSCPLKPLGRQLLGLDEWP